MRTGSTKSVLLNRGLLAALSMMAVCAGPAEAADTSQQHAVAVAQKLQGKHAALAWRHMTDSDRQAAMAALMPAYYEVTTSSGIVAVAASCTDPGSAADAFDCGEGYEVPDAGADVTNGQFIGTMDATDDFGSSLRSNGCWVARREYGVTSKNVFGGKLWGFYGQPEWCWSGSNVTSVTVNTTPLLFSSLWNYQGLIVNNQRVPKPPSGFVQSTTIGKFAFCMPVLGCLTHRTPKLIFGLTTKSGGYLAHS